MSESILFTLYEGNYDFGVGTLVNSAYKSGFNGKIIIGHKNEDLPFWVNQLKKSGETYLLPTEGSNIELIFRKIDTDNHLKHYKPTLFKIIFTEYPNAKVYYFDPDITVIGDWYFFEEWVDFGVACVLDENFPYMPYNHPIKYKWGKIFNYPINHSTPFNFYINSGFVGCQIKHINLIKDWETHSLMLEEEDHKLIKLNPILNPSIHYKRLNSVIGDQDVLNATINKNHLDYNLSIVGPEGMGFIPPAYLMFHNTGKKTWNKNFMLNFLKEGIKINPSDESFLANSQHPLVIFSKFRRFMLKINFIVTKIIQRIL